ncbi:MAG TPA: PAS domain S-box protein [Clostridia bacterium]|nr:PAS domain S-box protein [Clostridia bacterium]HQM96614.1 PAS domain S-box protein [Clostridia bacterium]
MSKQERFYESLIKESPIAYAYHKMIYDAFGNPVDYEFIDVNAAFEKMTSLNASDIIGKKVTEVLPNINGESFDWIKEYSKIAETMTSREFGTYAETLQKYYRVYASSLKKGYFTTVFIDITNTMRRTHEQYALITMLNDVLLELNDDFAIVNIIAQDEVLNKPKSEIQDKYIDDILPFEVSEKIKHHALIAKNTKKKVTFSFSMTVKNKEYWHICDCIYTKILNENRIILFMSDITEKHELEYKLKQSESLFRALFEQAPIGVALVKDFTFMSNINDKFVDIMGMSRDELVKTDWKDITHPEDLEEDLRYFNLFKTGQIPSYSMVKRFIRKNGSIVWVFMVITYLMLEEYEDRKDTHVCMINDITEIMEINDALKESERSKSVMLSHLPGIAYRCALDEHWTMHFISDGCLQLTGYPSASILNNKEITFNEIIAPEYRNSLHEQWEVVVHDKTFFKGEYEIITSEGKRKWVFEQGQCIYDNEDNPLFLEGLIIDITESKNRELRISYMNSHDMLTGLYNRMYFMNEMQRYDTRTCLPLSIIIGDINGVRLVNNAFGTRRGDSLLLNISQLIKKNCRAEDVVARIGGDDFAVLMPNTDNETASLIAEKIIHDCEKLSKKPLKKPVFTNISLGYATKNKVSENINQIFRDAEDLMFKRKLLDRKSSHGDILAAILASLFAKSEETEEHAQRLFELSKKIGAHFNLKAKEIDMLQLFTLLHDVGKIGIDDSILKKPGKLTDKEWVEMKKHPEIGYKIAISSPELEPIADLIYTHHEHYDGNGYPQGLRGEEIPLLSRILSVADAFDAITHDRVYRKAATAEEALEEINRCSGTQFDPKMVESLNKIYT